MRVLLAAPPRLFAHGEGHTIQVQPLGLGYVGAAIAAEHDVRFLLPDTRSYTGDDPWGEIAAAIADEAPDVVGLTAVTADYPAAVRFAELAKAIDPSMCVVLGGVHATTEPVAALEGAPSVDFVVQGDGESTMLELLRRLESGGVAGVRPDRIQGLVGAMPVGASPVRLLAHRSTTSIPSRSRFAMVWCGTTTSTRRSSRGW